MSRLRVITVSGQLSFENVEVQIDNVNELQFTYGSGPVTRTATFEKDNIIGWLMEEGGD